MRITTAHDFFGKLLLEQDEANADVTDHRAAINAAMTAWHLHEWAWNLVIKPDTKTGWNVIRSAFPEVELETFRSKDAFQEWVVSQCPAMAEMERVAVGAKHHADSQLEDYKGDFSIDFDRRDFNVARVQVRHTGEFSSGFSSGFDVTRLEDFDLLLRDTVEWWREFFEKIDAAQLAD